MRTIRVSRVSVLCRCLIVWMVFCFFFSNPLLSSATVPVENRGGMKKTEEVEPQETPRETEPQDAEEALEDTALPRWNIKDGEIRIIREKKGASASVPAPDSNVLIIHDEKK